MSADTGVKLPLHDRHASLGARFATFAGFEMPMRYGSFLDEHHAVRQRVGLFDVSHMGEVVFRGKDAIATVNRIITNDLTRIGNGSCLYTVMCNSGGGIVDDLLVYRLADDHILACVNASNIQKDFEYMRDAAVGACEVTDESPAYAQLAVQGPKAVALVDRVADLDVATIAPFHARYGHIAGKRTLLSRTGYTGEDGFELYISSDEVAPVFDALIEAGYRYDLAPTGLGARDTLRLEARLMLYGNDIDESTNPIEAGLKWVVKLDKGDFIGRAALAKIIEEGPKRRLRGFILQGRGMLRAHYPILRDGKKVGETTSGGPAPTVGGAIALGYVGLDVARESELDIEVRGRAHQCTVTRKPFYKRSGG